MKGILDLSLTERTNLFKVVSAKTNIALRVIEKDFWVCVVLQYLFNESYLKDYLIFKGGTSLSKCFALIDRFSEDIDLVLDWNLLGISDDDAFSLRNNSQQSKFIMCVNQKCIDYIRMNFIDDLKKHLLKNIDGLSIKYDENDPFSVYIKYPTLDSVNYVTPLIKLEIGPFSLRTPSEIKEILPLCNIYFNEAGITSIGVRSISPIRTFWEKILILHQESHRGNGNKLPNRYSRHYYDVYQMYQKGVFIKALEKIDELEKTVEFTSKFYPKAWARYDLAKPGSISLVPPLHSIKDLEEDYEEMNIMIYGERPSFDDILKVIQLIEHEINATWHK